MVHYFYKCRYKNIGLMIITAWDYYKKIFVFLLCLIPELQCRIMQNWENFSCLVNVSQDSLTKSAWILEPPNDHDFDMRSAGYVTAVLVSLIIMTGVPWNLLVICVVISKKLYNNPAIMLLINLTVANLLMCLLYMPFMAITGFSGEFLFGSTDAVRCRVCQTSIIFTTLIFAILGTLSLMSIDRLLYLKKPLTYPSLVSPKRMLVCIFIIWVLVAILSLPPLFGFGEIKFRLKQSNCNVDFTGRTQIAPNYFYLMILIAIVLTLISILIVMYIWIICIARKTLLGRLQKMHKTDIESTIREEGVACKKRNTELRLVRLFVAIFTAHLLTWTPMIIFSITDAVFGKPYISASLEVAGFTLVLSEVVIHPILQVSLIKEVRESVFGCFGTCKKMCSCVD